MSAVSAICILCLMFIIVEFWGYYKMLGLISDQSDLIGDLSWDVTRLENEVDLLQAQLDELKEVK